MTLASAGFSCCHVSACPSVLYRCSSEMAKRRIGQTMPHDSPGARRRWDRLNADEVAQNWWLLSRSIVNLARLQVYHIERPPYLSAARLPWCSASCGFCIFTARAMLSMVLGVVILSVCHTHAFWLIQRTYRRYFYTTWKGNPSSQMWFFVQLCNSWQDFNWFKGLRGPSPAAELLVSIHYVFAWHAFTAVFIHVSSCPYS